MCHIFSEEQNPEIKVTVNSKQSDTKLLPLIPQGEKHQGLY